jgi:ketosteroid isomerase-like protein
VPRPDRSPRAEVAEIFSAPAAAQARDQRNHRSRRWQLYDASMSLGKQDVRNLIDIYLQAWTTQDPDLILTVFTPTATYHERVLGEPICDHAGIREYWQSKVVEAQANIQTELLSLYLDGTTAIAEWEARFDDVVKGHRTRMREVAILELDGDRVASLREYWTSERVAMNS